MGGSPKGPSRHEFTGGADQLMSSWSSPFLECGTHLSPLRRACLVVIREAGQAIRSEVTNQQALDSYKVV